MEQLLCHLIGDYLLQTTWMATRKYTSWNAAIAHGVIYTIPFLLLSQDAIALSVICVTHILIDHYRLAGIWARLVNNQWIAPQPVIPPWCMVAIDQTMHLSINYLTLLGSSHL